MEGGRGRYPARLQPGARVSRGALLLVRDQLQPGRARRSRPLPRPPSPRALPGSRPRAPPPGGLRGGAEGGGLRRSPRRPLLCADGDHGRAGPQAGEPRRRPPLAPGPLVSRTRTRVAGPPPPRSAPGHRSARSRPRRAGPGRAGLGRAWPGRARRVGGRRPAEDSASAAAAAQLQVRGARVCWATGGESPLCAGDQAGRLRRGAPESGDRRVPGLLSRREDRKMGSGAAPLPGSGPLGGP